MSTTNRPAARQCIDAFNARDDEGEVAARTADHLAYAPDSLRLPPLEGGGGSRS